MKERILTGWNFKRVIYVALGIFIIVQATLEQQWFAAFFGSYFAAMGIFQFGCASGECYNIQVKDESKSNVDIHEINFEEIKKD